MPPNIGIPTVEFRSLLLPPIRVPLRALQIVVRPRCAHQAPHAFPRVTQCLAQFRSLHLYKTARAKTLLGQHKVMTFDTYKVASPGQSQHTVNLVKSEKDAGVIAADISLQQLYDDHMGPGKMLYLTHDLPKGVAENIVKMQTDNSPAHFRNFALMEPYTCIKKGARDISIRAQKGKQLGQLKCIMIRLSSPAAYFKHCLDRAYQFIDSGSPVEIRIRLRGSTSKEEKIKAGPISKWQWMHDHWPHLRPDFILKSMPEGSLFLIDPVSDGYIVQFVIASKQQKMPKSNLTLRLWKVKKGVSRSTKMGKQTQLPKIMRQQLVDEGSAHYSVHSGLPKAQALAGYTKDKSVAKWGFEGEDVPLGQATPKPLEPGGIQTVRAEASAHQPEDPAEAFPDIGQAEAAIRAKEQAIDQWLADIRLRNAVLPPVDGSVPKWTVRAQEYEAQAEDAERRGEHGDPAVLQARLAARDALRAVERRKGLDYKNSKGKSKVKSKRKEGLKAAWQGRGKRK